jgi:uncharacterized protein with GYD domain
MDSFLSMRAAHRNTSILAALFSTMAGVCCHLVVAPFRAHSHQRKKVLIAKEANWMPHYMVQIAYTAEATARLTKHPQDRSVAVEELLEKLGGRLISPYFCFGEDDVIGIGELPDDTAATAAEMAAVSASHIQTFKMTKLLTVEEAMEAMCKAGKPGPTGPSTG